MTEPKYLDGKLLFNQKTEKYYALAKTSTKDVYEDVEIPG
jgi:hypothetical protein